MKCCKKLFPVFFLLFASIATYAQEHSTRQSLLWSRYYMKLKVDKAYTIRHEVEERIFIKNQRQHQFMTRVFADRYLGKGWNAAVGMSYFIHSVPQDPEIENYSNRAELRPVLELGKSHFLSRKIELDHRYWHEFRFNEQPDQGIEFSNMRLRYRLELRYHVSESVKIRLLDEVLFNAAGGSDMTFFDQNRMAGAVQYFPKKQLGFELTYINWYQKNFGVPEFYKRDIVRLTLMLNLSLVKQEVN